MTMNQGSRSKSLHYGRLRSETLESSPFVDLDLEFWMAAQIHVGDRTVHHLLFCFQLHLSW